MNWKCWSECLHKWSLTRVFCNYFIRTHYLSFGLKQTGYNFLVHSRFGYRTITRKNIQDFQSIIKTSIRKCITYIKENVSTLDQKIKETSESPVSVCLVCFWIPSIERLENAWRPTSKTLTFSSFFILIMRELILVYKSYFF